MTVFFSDAVGQERLIFNSQPVSPATRQNWKTLSALYQSGLRACGLDVQTVVRPEIYQTAAAREVLGVRTSDWHLAIKPIKHLRPFHGMPNVFLCNWPYAELSASVLGGVPFYDQLRLLRMADVIICSTDFTAGILRDAGLKNVVALPPYVASDRDDGDAVRPIGMQRVLVDTETLRLSRCLGPVLEGFKKALGRREDLELMVDATAAVRREAKQMLGNKLVLAEHGLAAADFLLCAVAPCGLPLEMVRAMLSRVPLIAPTEGVFAALAPPGAAVPLMTEPAAVSTEEELIAAHMRLTWHQPTAEGVCDAILMAASLDTDARNRMAATCREMAKRLFSADAFRSGLNHLMARL